MPVRAQIGLGVSLRSVRRTFAGGVVAVDGVSLEVPPGQFVALLGPSGCGKSTLLRMIAGLDRPDAGAAEIVRNEPNFRSDPREPAPAADSGLRATQVEGVVCENEPNSAVTHAIDVAYVFQDAHLLPWRTVLDNAALPLELRNEPKSIRRERAVGVLEQLGLGDALWRYPAQLSGGMRMRVSLARALVTDPKLLLLDEPFAALDEITRQRLDEMLRELWLDRQMTVLFVTHSISEATFLAGRAVVFSRRPARVVLDQPIDLPEHRTVELRAEAEFARQMRDLHRALAAEEVEV